jgi:hypothetical protein
MQVLPPAPLSAPGRFAVRLRCARDRTRVHDDARTTHANRRRWADGNWIEYDELRAYEDEREEASNTTRSRKHKKGRKGGGKIKPPKKYLIPPMQYAPPPKQRARKSTRASSGRARLRRSCDRARSHRTARVSAG